MASYNVQMSDGSYKVISDVNSDQEAVYQAHILGAPDGLTPVNMTRVPTPISVMPGQKVSDNTPPAPMLNNYAIRHSDGSISMMPGSSEDSVFKILSSKDGVPMPHAIYKIPVGATPEDAAAVADEAAHDVIYGPNTNKTYINVMNDGSVTPVMASNADQAATIASKNKVGVIKTVQAPDMASEADILHMMDSLQKSTPALPMSGLANAMGINVPSGKTHLGEYAAEKIENLYTKSVTLPGYSEEHTAPAGVVPGALAGGAAGLTTGGLVGGLVGAISGGTIGGLGMAARNFQDTTGQGAKKRNASEAQ